jgi:hypothetical protein
MKTKVSIIAAVAALAVAGCGGSSHPSYPANVQTNFENSCEQSTTVSKCDCALNWIEAHVSLSDFQSAETSIENGGNDPNWVYQAIDSCASA